MLGRRFKTGWHMTIGNSPLIFVVSVKSFTDRHRSIEMQAKKNELRFDYIWLHDAEELTEADLQRCDTAVLPLRSISTVLKHLEAQARLLQSEAEWCLILEDDALLAPDFKKRYRKVLDLISEITEPCLLFLGGTDNRLDARFHEAQSLRFIESPLTTAEAYMVNRSGCSLRMQYLDSHIINRPADHFLKSIDQILGIKHYRVSAPFVSQGSITGKFQTSLDQNRAKHGRLYLRLRYEWNRFRKQKLPKFVAWLKVALR